MKNLAAAFLATTYRVEAGERRFDLRVGAVRPDFDAFLLELAGDEISCWAIVTAVNPGGRCSDEDNAARQGALVRRVRASGVRVLPACNLSEDGSWPAEPALLLVGLGENAARALAADFEQAACVCGNIGGAARLVWCELGERTNAAENSG